MSETVQGIPASPGIAIGQALLARWPRLDIPHATVAPDQIGSEVERFRQACQQASLRTRQLRDSVAQRLGSVQAKIFDPQLLMLEDPDLIEGTVTYITDSFLTAERAFSLRVLEFRSQWLDATHARVMDRVADLNDVQLRVLAELIDLPELDLFQNHSGGPMILVAHDLTPSRMVEIDPEQVIGIATDGGTRTAHASILARSLGLPTVVGLGDLSRRVETGQELIVDGLRGRVIIAPTDAERNRYHHREVRVKETEAEVERLAELEPVTRDGIRIGLHANLDLPADAARAVAANADGVGLFRTEFLVVGKTSMPDEEEQLEAFRGVLETMAPRPVTIRTFDLGGDKFPMFLPPITEENPFLGWRGLRIYEMMPELFHHQARAVLRAAALGQIQLLIPMVNSVDDVIRIRAVIDKACDELKREGLEHRVPPLGLMLETPAAIAIVEKLARHADFFSIGTNDLIQYMLAVDRGNAQLLPFFDLYHPALLRYIHDAASAASKLGRPLCVCGEAASDTLGAVLLLGLGIRSLSCAPNAILEQKKLIRALDLESISEVVIGLLEAETGLEIRRRVQEVLGDMVDLTDINSNTSLSHPG
ncbi:MAG: phosphoenolpyruvate--protein phosphotransferase [Gemmatimonadetes bacterium]|uniref:Phosphoenolpyruvate-protein phosphotransferase n=1 Tax=Candidatus Kutchimonas denitrificans TaxID=3056748 RepID=A0AAE4ZC56_9BACT|nr:phosphoenolpyruvate--protein phosphotransferase [Gemmatimonadota bacterium]NIR75701.1 phosphoenolpyruvate--protein phosphotransferase [Candidatus Kutchimonas denitrificans]NIS00314.1 phosphoenolpyruvate--protein phosphotransferase [Gemmatimonadota bacterium]NIT65973.1 phosphoenolpyruvate--protein phosphotransferase [Gemmatimonadota bacterium]NIU53677.1 phosphoenolpyruvate--protein phosphotransferase [Gemmatimonadota bacterium]